MLKNKNKKALLKRIKITKTGKWKKANAYTSHLAQNKSTKQKRHLRKSTLVSKSDKKRLKGLVS